MRDSEMSVVQNSLHMGISFFKKKYLLSCTISGKIMKKQAFRKELSKQV